jgi:hypothetical protein
MKSVSMPVKSIHMPETYVWLSDIFLVVIAPISRNDMCTSSAISLVDLFSL